MTPIQILINIIKSSGVCVDSDGHWNNGKFCSECLLRGDCWVKTTKRELLILAKEKIRELLGK